MTVQPGDFRSRQPAQALPDGFDPLVDGALRYTQFSGDFLAREALRYVNQDLLLLGGKRPEDGHLVERVGHGPAVLRHVLTGNKYISAPARAGG